MVGFSGGYVAITGTRSTWFSADGRTWTSAELPFTAATDPTGNSLDANAVAITTDGKRVLVVGGYAHAPCVSAAAGATGGGPACPYAPLAWISTNGRTWQSAFPGPLPPATPGSTQGSEFDAAWPVPTGGWDAALSFWNGERLAGRDLWHSADGMSWTPLTPAPALTGPKVDPTPWVHAGVADQTGRRLLWQGWMDFSVTLPSGAGSPVVTLASSPDGRAWTGLPGFPGKNAEVLAGVARPTHGVTRWVIAGASGFSSDQAAKPTVWFSDDRATWTAVALPVPPGSRVWNVWSLIRTRSTYVAVGFWSDGASADHATWGSADGAAWTLMASPEAPGQQFGPHSIADGPAGVIGIGDGPTGETAVWSLR